ncbi:hypothetical protein Pta02_27850 [Planobispora takensis]|uniref:Uncharacterized protein n=1 Tax=Planobispora takensis TaxID=1367882 RepID=A0A8J3SX55_9ACTN|nr:hypothetical protein Pta02_27850 [Planobispora takensis]
MLVFPIACEPWLASDIEDAHTPGTDEEAEDDEDDPPQEVATGEDHVDPRDDEYDCDNPKQSSHKRQLPLGTVN